MEGDLRRALRRRCRETFGAGLRVAFWYSLDSGVDYEMIRFRRDIRENYADADAARAFAATLVADMRDRRPDRPPEQLPGVGALRATTSVFNEAVIVHVGAGEWGVVASYDTGVDIDLMEFTAFCESWLEEAAAADLRSTDSHDSMLWGAGGISSNPP